MKIKLHTYIKIGCANLPRKIIDSICPHRLNRHVLVKFHQMVKQKNNYKIRTLSRQYSAVNIIILKLAVTDCPVSDKTHFCNNKWNSIFPRGQLFVFMSLRVSNYLKNNLSLLMYYSSVYYKLLYIRRSTEFTTVLRVSIIERLILNPN